jgi:hypothetical protein
MIDRRDYFAAHCPEAFLVSYLSNRSIEAYKKAMFNRNMISRAELNEYDYDITVSEMDYVECLIRFEYADMMIKAGDK